MKRTILSAVICILCAAMLIGGLSMPAQACEFTGSTYGNTEARHWVSSTSSCSHKWAAATCTTPAYCENCFATAGKPLGHDWIGAVNRSGIEGRICVECQEVEMLAYDWIPLTDCEKIMASNEEGHFQDVVVGNWNTRAGKLEDSLRFCVSGKESYKRTHYIIYKLNGNFDALSGLVSFMDKSDKYATAKIHIYLDNELAYESGVISDLSNDESFTLDVSGVDVVRIVCSTQDKHTAYCALSASVY